MDKLFPYQLDGVSFLASKTHALLGDSMGLGKSAQAIRGLDRVHAHKILVICPSVARVNWVKEFNLWEELKREHKVLVQLKDTPLENGVSVCSFDYASENYEKLKAHKWDAMVVDECHFLKSHKAKRSIAILGAKGIIRSVKRCWLMSGTPAPNHSGELWVMLYTFGLTPLSYDSFIKRYCITQVTSYGIKILGTKPDRLSELKVLLNSVMLRRRKEDVMKELPPITFGHVAIEAGPVDIDIMPSFTQYFIPFDRREELKEKLAKEAELMRTVMDNMGPGRDDKLKVIDGISNSISTLRRYVGLQKCSAVIELVSRELEHKSYNKIVIFAIHRDVIETLRAGLRKFGVVTLYGQTDPEKRTRNIHRFQTNPKCQVFIGNILAAGTAITLTAAHHVLFVEQDWVPGNNAQAIMRCHRIGQDKPVSVRFVGISGTLDDQMTVILKRKTKELTEIFDIDDLTKEKV